MVDFRSQNTIFKSLQSYLNVVSTALTDFTIGSVLNSLFYAVSNGIADLYATAQSIYTASFVKTAEGDDLDDRVADFTLRRRLSTRSSGFVTFYRTSKTSSDIIVPANTTVKTITTDLIPGLEYKTILESTLPVTIFDEEIEFLPNKLTYDLFTRKVFDVTKLVATVNNIENVELTKNADYHLDISDITRAKIVFDNVINPDLYSQFKITYEPLSIDIAVQASNSGSQSNVTFGTIVNCQSKPAGIDEVINYESTSGGTDNETDDELRNRVPLFLSSLSKGTKDALKAAALSIDGVKNANIIEPDPPNGIVTVFIDDGSGTSTVDLIRAVKDKINGTTNGVENNLEAGIRSAGIAVNVTSPTVKQITINATVTLNIGYDTEIVKNEIITNVGQWLNSHATGKNVLRADLIRIIKEVNGVYNIDLSTLTMNGLLLGDVTVNTSEAARLTSISIRAKI